jgi:hypothetical protein
MPFMQVTGVHVCRQMSPHVGSIRRRGAPTEHPGRGHGGPRGEYAHPLSRVQAPGIIHFIRWLDAV